MSVYWVTGCLLQNHRGDDLLASSSRRIVRHDHALLPDVLPARGPAALGAPPPECTVQQDFDDAPGLQAVLLDDAASVRRAWERDMENRMASSERMLHEIHAMVLALRPAPAAAAPAASAPAGSAAQLAAAMAHGPPVPATSGAVSDSAPWPSYLTVEGLLNVPGTNNVDRQVPPIMHVLPGDTQEMVAACSSSALPLHVRIPDRLKAKIWAGEYDDLALLLHDNFAQPQDYALSIQSAGDGQGPTLCVSPAKGKIEVLSFQQWLKAFEMFMSVYLVHPGHLPSAPHMLKYIETVRNLSERGDNWQAYDEAFRSLRQQRGWAWDSVNSELWMNASQSPARRVFPSGGSPFPGKGKARPRSTSPCFTYNRGGSCRETRVALPTNAAVVTVPTHRPVAGPLRSGTVPVPPSIQSSCRTVLCPWSARLVSEVGCPHLFVPSRLPLLSMGITTI